MDIKKEIETCFEEIKQGNEVFKDLDLNLLKSLLDIYDENQTNDDKAIVKLLSDAIEGYTNND